MQRQSILRIRSKAEDYLACRLLPHSVAYGAQEDIAVWSLPACLGSRMTHDSLGMCTAKHGVAQDPGVRVFITELQPECA